LGRFDVDPWADVERRQLGKLSKARQDFTGGSCSVEAPGMAAPLEETTHCNVEFAGAVDVDHAVRRSLEPVRGRAGVQRHPRHAPERHQDGTIGACRFLLEDDVALSTQSAPPGGVADPLRLEQPIEDVTLSIRARLRRGANRRPKVVLPLPGNPEITTKGLRIRDVVRTGYSGSTRSTLRRPSEENRGLTWSATYGAALRRSSPARRTLRLPDRAQP
jgi:hypothetical protein